MIRFGLDVDIVEFHDEENVLYLHQNCTGGVFLVERRAPLRGSEHGDHIRGQPREWKTERRSR
jgi:hypothetical protein